jgi:hypothetical protein
VTSELSEFATLRATLKRGALIAAANWPVIVIQFIAEANFKLLLAVPVVGGVLLVGLALGQDVQEMLGGGAREIATSVAGALLDHPGAFASFLLSALVVVLGGSTLMFLIKAGTVTVLARGAVAAGPLDHAPFRFAALERAAAFSIETFLEGCARLFRRYLRLGLFLLGLYALSGLVFLLVLVGAYRIADRSGLIVAWTLIAMLASSALIVWIMLANLAYLLLQMIVATDDCSVRQAARRALLFLRRDLRHVILIFALVLTLVVLATIASMLATAGLGVVSFVPLLGLAVLPLQAAAWLVRGLVFQYLGLSALGAYLSLYQRGERLPAETVPTVWARTAS